MKLGLTFNAWVDEDLMFAQQLGVNDIIAETVLPSWAQAGWDVAMLRALRNRVEKAGLTLVGLDGLPCRVDGAALDATAWDDSIETVCRFVRLAGAAGIPLISYAWTFAPTGSAERKPLGRGGALVTSIEEQAPSSTRAAAGELSYFLGRVIPVAERAQVHMACRPVSGLQTQYGTPLLEHVLECVPNPCNGLDLEPAALAIRRAAELDDTLSRLGSGGALQLITLQNYAGRTQTCLDEGDTDMLALLRTCHALGYEGVIRPGPQPGTLDDTPWGHKAQAFAVGYLRALLQVVVR